MGQQTTQLWTQNAEISWSAVPDQLASTALGAVAVIDGPIPDFELIKNLLAERIQPSLDHTCGPALDIAQHVQRVALPQPSDEADLFQAIAYALERPLEFDRLLWECWIIEGLNDNQWAILIKIHHSMAEHVPATHLLTRLCDDAEPDAFTNHTASKQISAPPVYASSWADALWQAPVSMFKAAARAVTGATTSLAAAAAAAVMWPPVGPSATTRMTTVRRYRTVRIPRAAVDRVSRKFGVTANDVALAAVTEGFRTVLVRRGEQPRADSLRTLGPVLSYLPVEHSDPIRQLQAVHSQLGTTGRTNDRPTGLSPVELCTKAIQSLTRLPRQGVVTLSTSTPGPRQRLRLLGQRIQRLLPIPPAALQLSTGVAVLSYGDELVFGITTDYDAVSDMEQLAAGIESGMARLMSLSKDSVLLFDRRRKRPFRRLPNNAARWQLSPRPVRVRH